MKKRKLILWIGVALLFLGALIFAISFAVSGFTFEFLSDVQIEYKTFEERADNEITSLSIEYDTADVVVYVSADSDTLSVQYPQKHNKKGKNITVITLEETQNSLSIKQTKELSFVPFDFSNPTVSIYLPQERVYALDLYTSTGTIRLASGNLNVSKITLKATTGDIFTKDCAISSIGEARFETTTGDVNVGELSAQTVDLKTNTGFLTAHKAIKAETSLSLNAATGSIKTLGTITANTVTAQASTGDLNITADIYANTITLKTSTGDLNAQIAGKKPDYSILVSHSTGNSNLFSQTGGTKTLNVSCSTGDIYVAFGE